MGMERFVITALVAAGFGAAVSPALATSAPRARLKSPVCQRALDPPARGVAITAVMRPLTGTTRMQLRFQLLSRLTPSSSFGLVSGGDLGTWIDPRNATLGQRLGDVWILKKQAVNLAAPAEYRFRVSFRWFGAHDRVIGTASRESELCSQPELRPDVLVESITVTAVAGRPKLNRYVATIRNAGATASGPFSVLFSPGAGLPTRWGVALGHRWGVALGRRRRAGGGAGAVWAPVQRGSDPPLDSLGHEDRNSPRIHRCPRALHVWQRVHDTLDQA